MVSVQEGMHCLAFVCIICTYIYVCICVYMCVYIHIYSFIYLMTYLSVRPLMVLDDQAKAYHHAAYLVEKMTQELRLILCNVTEHKEPPDEGERGERTSWLITQHSKNEDQGI